MLVDESCAELLLEEVALEAALVPEVFAVLKVSFEGLASRS